MANILHANYKDEWETPPEFFARLNDVFDFYIDLFASEKNALCKYYYGKEPWDHCLPPDDELEGAWRWANPPYGKGMSNHIRGILDSYIYSARRTVMLLPANTDTKWFHELVLPYAHIVWIKGRLQFLYNGERPRNAKGQISGNTGGNFLAIYGPNLLQTNAITARPSADNNAPST